MPLSIPPRTEQKKGPLPSACPATRDTVSALPGACSFRKHLQQVCRVTSWTAFQLLSIPSPVPGGSQPRRFLRSSLSAPSPSSPHSRVTAATTSCLLKRRSVCSSWRRPSAPWTLTADCPLTSLSKPQLPEVPGHCP